ncbi:MAG: hypothetical protein Q9223_003339 [Gallowayella weberi]
MDDDISPTSSRTTTPAPEETNMHQPPFSIDPVTELSYRLEQHTLQARRQQQLTPFEPPTLSPPSSETEPPSSLHARCRHSPSLLVRQQRQAITRRQYTTTHHLSHISALVEDMSHDNANPSSSCEDDRSPISPTSSTPASLFFQNFDSTPSSSGSEDCCPDPDGDCAPSNRILAGKIEKEWRRGAVATHSLAREQKLVLRKIRMRKSGRRGTPNRGELCLPLL